MSDQSKGEPEGQVQLKLAIPDPTVLKVNQGTRQESSMIHSAGRVCFVLIEFEMWGRTYMWICVNMVITTRRDCGSITDKDYSGSTS